MDFEIPPAKRTEPADGSTTESESDLDVMPASSNPASALVLTPSKGTVAAPYHANLCSPWLVLGGRKSFPGDDSVTESESDDELLDEEVRICHAAKLHSRSDDFSSRILARVFSSTLPRSDPRIHLPLTRSITSASLLHLASIYGHISVTVLNFSSNGTFLDAVPFLEMTWVSARRYRSSRSSPPSCVNLGRYRIKSDGGTAFRSSRIANSGGKAESYPRLMTSGQLR
jgi:hypothetical protein